MSVSTGVPQHPFPSPTDPGSLVKRFDDASREIERALKPDSEILAELQRRFADAERARKPQERTWKQNIAYLEGMQYLRRVQDTLLNTEGLRPVGAVRVAVNKLLDSARRLHARIDQPGYEPSVQALTDDPGDHQAAQAAHGALRWFYHNKRVRAEKRRLLWWVIACGVAYVEPYYDPASGPLHPVQAPDAVGGGGEPELAPMGDPEFVIRSPFAVYRDPRFEDWRQVQYVFVTEMATRDDLLERYGASYEQRTGNVLEDQVRDGKVTLASPWMPQAAPGTKEDAGVPTPPLSAEGVHEVTRYYERPSRVYPEGRQIIYLAKESVLLYRGSLDTPRRTIPLVAFGYRNRPWVLEDASPVTQSRALQRLYNRMASRWGDHMVRLPGGWILDPITSGIQKNAFTNQAGGRIRYNPFGGKPEIVPPPLQGIQFYGAFMQLLVGEIEEQMALPPSMRGQMPRGAKAAKTIELLNEAADAVQQPTLNGIAESWREVYLMVLDLMDRYWKTDRFLYLLSSERTPQAMEFKGEGLPRDWRDRLNVQVESEAAMPASRLARIQFIVGLARGDGVFGPPGSPQYVRLLRAALHLNAGELPNDEGVDVSIARQENLVLMRGTAVQVRVWDNDPVHLREHVEYIKRMIASGRESEAGVLVQHTQAQEQQMAAKAEKAKQAAGTPPPGPAAPPHPAPHGHPRGHRAPPHRAPAAGHETPGGG